jgi:hypothetical protein
MTNNLLLKKLKCMGSMADGLMSANPKLRIYNTLLSFLHRQIREVSEPQTFLQ